MEAARTLTDLFSPEDARDIARMFRRAARQGVASRQMELDLGGRRAFISLTVSSVQARHGKIGLGAGAGRFGGLVQAHNAAAWQEVAQRIAHEIKNPAHSHSAFHRANYAAHRAAGALPRRPAARGFGQRHAGWAAKWPR